MLVTFPEPTHDTYYAVARGHSVGVFTDYNDVKEHIKNYPQPLHKKWPTLEEAIAYFHKFYDGKVEAEKTAEKPEKRESKRKSGTETEEKEKEVEKKKKKK
uniref:ribonuclease H n=1 Tax=Caenorhabditis japonica TaxID=281687 RepID=A0A8R1I6F1_CAEJA